MDKEVKDTWREKNPEVNSLKVVAVAKYHI
jgi:hypothetical protein